MQEIEKLIKDFNKEKELSKTFLSIFEKELEKKNQEPNSNIVYLIIRKTYELEQKTLNNLIKIAELCKKKN